MQLDYRQSAGSQNPERRKNPVPASPKRPKGSMGGQKSKNLSVSRIHVKMMDIIQHIGYIPGIDDAI